MAKPWLMDLILMNTPFGFPGQGTVEASRADPIDTSPGTVSAALRLGSVASRRSPLAGFSGRVPLAERPCGDHQSSTVGKESIAFLTAGLLDVSLTNTYRETSSRST